MKSYFFSLVFLIMVVNAKAQSPITGFLGIKFGSSKMEVKSMLTEKISKIDYELNNLIAAVGITQSLTSAKTDYAFYYFTNSNQFSRGELPIGNHYNKTALEVYNEIENKLILKYGPGEKKIEINNSLITTTWSNHDNYNTIDLIYDDSDPNYKIRFIATSGYLDAIRIRNEKENKESGY